MISQLIIAVACTIGVSSLCSILEAMILSVTTAEIEDFKDRSPQLGQRLGKFRDEIDETSSAILSLNTIANTLGATLVGGLAEKSFGNGENTLLLFACGMTLGILFFAEILPKNLAVSYRTDMLPYLVPPLVIVRFCMSPFSKICKFTMRAMVPEKRNPVRKMKMRSFYLLKKVPKKAH